MGAQSKMADKKRKIDAAPLVGAQSGPGQDDAGLVSDAFIAAIREALQAAPEVFDFDLSQTAGQRAKMIEGLPSDARVAALDIIIRHVLDGYEVPAEDHSLEFLMQTEGERAELDGDDEELICSDDWRLRIFRGSGGTGYDFNGWPRGNEGGAGGFYPAHGDEPVDIFGNGDEDLVPAEDEFSDLDGFVAVGGIEY